MGIEEAAFDFAVKYENEAILAEKKAEGSPIAYVWRDQAVRNRLWAAQNLAAALVDAEMHKRLAPWRTLKTGSVEWFDLAVEDERSAVRAEIMVDYTDGADQEMWRVHAKAQRARALRNFERALRKAGLLPPLPPEPRPRRWYDVDDDDLFVDV